MRSILPVSSLVSTIRNSPLRHVIGSTFGTVGLSIFLAIVLISLFAPFLPLPDPLHVDLHHRFLSPLSPGHLLGTDQLGRDLLSRVTYGGRTTLAIALLATSFGMIVGTSLGLIAGFFGGITGAVIIRLVDIELSIPMMLLALLIIAVLGPNMGNLVLVLGLTAWVRVARIVRAEALVLRRREFVAAAYVMGVSRMRVLVRHLLPNVLSTVLTIATLEMSRLVLLEVSLSFLGLGVQPPNPAWGRMLAESRSYVAASPWLIVVPGIAVLLTVLCINLMSDSVRRSLQTMT
jgi:peptide/nickel transport system permease protein